MDRVTGYLQLLTIAIGIGRELYDGVRGIVEAQAANNLTPQEYADLESRWSEDKLRAAANAGINPLTGLPFIPPPV